MPLFKKEHGKCVNRVDEFSYLIMHVQQTWGSVLSPSAQANLLHWCCTTCFKSHSGQAGKGSAGAHCPEVATQRRQPVSEPAASVAGIPGGVRGSNREKKGRRGLLATFATGSGPLWRALQPDTEAFASAPAK